MAGTCMTCFSTGNQVWKALSAQLVCIKLCCTLTYPSSQPAAEDEVVLLADVDKQGLSDLVKLLNRQASLQPVCSTYLCVAFTCHRSP